MWNAYSISNGIVSIVFGYHAHMLVPVMMVTLESLLVVTKVGRLNCLDTDFRFLAFFSSTTLETKIESSITIMLAIAVSMNVGASKLAIRLKGDTSVLILCALGKVSMRSNDKHIGPVKPTLHRQTFPVHDLLEKNVFVCEAHWP
jgi:hypothetical protein